VRNGVAVRSRRQPIRAHVAGSESSGSSTRGTKSTAVGRSLRRDRPPVQRNQVCQYTMKQEPKRSRSPRQSGDGAGQGPAPFRAFFWPPTRSSTPCFSSASDPLARTLSRALPSREDSCSFAWSSRASDLVWTVPSSPSTFSSPVIAALAAAQGAEGDRIQTSGSPRARLGPFRNRGMGGRRSCLGARSVA